MTGVGIPAIFKATAMSALLWTLAIAARVLRVGTPRASAHDSKERTDQLRPRATTTSKPCSQESLPGSWQPASGSTTTVVQPILLSAAIIPRG